MKRTLKKSMSILLAFTLLFSSLAFGFSDVNWADFVVKAKAEETLTEGYYTYVVDENSNATIIGVDKSISGDVTVPASIGGYPVTSIGNYVFRGCSGLTSIKILDSVTKLGNYAFEECEALVSAEIGNGVVDMGDQTFKNCKNLTSVKIGNSVTEIGENTFYYCLNLTDIDFGNSITSIGKYAFYYCEKLTDMEFPDTVTGIGEFSFSACHGLKTVKLGKGISNIYKQAFYNCSAITDVYYSGNLEDWCKINFDGYASNPMVYAKNLYIDGDLIKGDITIPDGVVSIGNAVFYGCEAITGVTFPESITNIGDSAFSNCSGLASITIPDSVTSIGDYAFYNCTSLSGAVIPDSVSDLGIYVFAGCKNLTSITLPKNLTSIGAGMFSGCSSLASITIPDSVTSIGASAFSNCTGLTSITIPDDVTDIGNYAFKGCIGLTGITIPASVTNLGESTFADCTNLNDIKIINDEITIGGGAFSNTAVLNNEANYENGAIYIDNILIGVVSSTSGEFAVREGTRSIGATAFYGCSKITSIRISENVKYIGENAFYDCTGLVSITIPKSVKKIGGDAFKNCTSLTDVYYSGELADWSKTEFVTALSNPASFAKNFYVSGTLLGSDIVIPDGTTEIGAYAFANRTELTSITIPDSVTSIGDYAFYNCTNLKDVYYKGTVGGWCGIKLSNSCSLLSNAQNLYIGGSLVEGDIVIPEGVTDIPDYAFYNRTGITSVSLPDSLINIGRSAFEKCTSLNNLTVPVNVADIGYSAFTGCSSLDTLTWNAANANGTGNIGTNIKVLTVGPDVKVLSNGVFGTGITTLYYNAVNCDTNRKFVYCTNLSEVHIGETVERFHGFALYNTPFYNDDSNWTTVDGSYKALIIDNCLIRVESASGDIKIPDGIRLIASDAFSYCSMSNVEFPESLKFICDGAFEQCIYLEKVEIPKSVEYIGYLAFYSLRSAEYYKVDEENKYYSSDSFGVLFNKDKTELIQYPLGNKRDTYRVPNTVIKILDYAFSGPSIADDKMGQEPCGFLVTIYIADSVEEIGLRSFYFTNTLVYLNIGTDSNLKSIGKEAFYRCSKVSEKYLHIPAGVETIEKNILNSGSKICSLTDECLAKTYAEENGHAFTVCKGHVYDNADEEESTTNADPGETEPDVSVPSVSAPELTTDPIGAPITKPATTEPAVTEPATGPSVTEPSTTKPVEVPTTTKPVVTEPATTKPAEITKPAVKDDIIKKPSTTEVKYGETLILHADFTNIPADAKIEWSVEGEGVTIKPSEDGKTCAVTSTATGDATITAKYVDADGVEHVSEQEIESNASFWQKIVSFFKNLFGINRIIEQVIKF